METSPTSVPHRFSRANFDFYAPAIGRALTAFPEIIEEDSKPYSIETYSQRFRDAVTAKARYGYQHEAIDEGRFIMVGNQLVLSNASGKIIIGSREAIKAHGKKQAVAQPVMPEPKGIEIELTDNALNVVTQVCSLLSNRLLNPPPVFIVNDFLAEYKQVFEQRYDVTFIPDPVIPNRYRII